MTTFLASLPAAELSAEERAALLTTASGRGADGPMTPQAQDAAMRLLSAYAPALRAAVGRTAHRLDADEAEAVAVEAALLVFRSHLDSSWRDLLGHLHAAVRDALASAMTSARSPMSGIDDRERRRFFAHLYGTCNGDLSDALARLDEVRTMSRRRFADLTAALLGVVSLEAPTAYGDASVSDRSATESAALAAPDATDAIADRELVAWLLTLPSERDALIVRLYYGFTGPDLTARREAAGFRADEELGDREVGAILGLSWSATIRARTKALATMRAALALDTEAGAR